MSGCTARVPDHTDFVDCGEPTVGSTGMCIVHLKYRIDCLRVEAGEAETRAALANAQAKALSLELERHELPLFAKVI